MELKETNCPRCNALQKFGKQVRPVEDGLVEVFIRCSMCRWERVVIKDYPARIHHTRKIKKLRNYSKYDPRALKDLKHELEKHHD